MPTTPSTTSTVPTTSIFGRSVPAGVRTKKTSAPMIAKAAKNRFTYRVQRQVVYSMSTPPSSRPTAPPAPEAAPKMPNARERSFGSVNVVASSDRAARASRAPKAPWAARPATSIVKFTAAPASADEAAKPTHSMM